MYMNSAGADAYFRFRVDKIAQHTIEGYDTLRLDYPVAVCLIAKILEHNANGTAIRRYHLPYIYPQYDSHNIRKALGKRLQSISYHGCTFITIKGSDDFEDFYIKYQIPYVTQVTEELV